MTRSVRREFVALLCALSHDLTTSRARFPRIRDAAAVQDLEGELSYWLEGDSAADTSAASDAAEALVLARSAPKDDDKVLRLERENAVLKRAVAIQAQRLKAQSDDIDRLAKKNEDQADKLKQAEHTNYSLSVHLRHSSPGALGDFNFRHPDIC